MRPSILVALLAAAIAPAAWGEIEALHAITSEGSAVVSVAPSVVDFWLTSRFAGDSLREAAEKALAFEEKLKELLESRELKPDSLTVSGVSIPDLKVKEAVVSARVRFALSLYSDAEERSLSLAKLCDAVRELGDALKCSAEGPFLGVAEREGVEQDAVARAVENALSKADAVSSLMDSQIVDVQEVVVQGVEWNPAGEPLPTLPDVQRLTCQARVTVVYRYMPY